MSGDVEHLLINNPDGSIRYRCGVAAARSASIDPVHVTCQDCLDLMIEGSEVRPPEERVIHYAQQIQWHERSSAPYKCGAMDGSASNKTGAVTCIDCLNLLVARDTYTSHTPPLMNDSGDGIFEFYDVDHGFDNPLEVVPQTTGNVEITVGKAGRFFTLHHLDRADLIRALLHDFHYSPERGGPNDE